MKSIAPFDQNNSILTCLLVGCGDYGHLILSPFLNSEGFPTIRAESGQQAVTKAMDFEPELILLNSSLNGTNFLSLLHILLVVLPNSAIIIISDSADIPDAIAAITMGALDILEIPVNLKILKRTIDAELSRQIIKKELETIRRLGAPPLPA